MHRTEKKGTNGYFQKKGMYANKWLMKKKNSNHQTLVRVESSGNSRYGQYSSFGKMFISFLKLRPAQKFCSQCLPKRIENMCSEKTCTRMFIATVLLPVANWKQPRCSSVEEWTNYGTPKLESSHPAEKGQAASASRPMDEGETASQRRLSHKRIYSRIPLT